MKVITFFLSNEYATRRLGNDLSRALSVGDLVTLTGDVGTGKTTLCRALIQSIANDNALDVPSPTYSLVQIYDTVTPIAHFDLYRLQNGAELDELGLSEALENGIALIEWPQNAQNYLPSATIAVELKHQENGRVVTITCADSAHDRISRTLALRNFLINSGHGQALRKAFVGDASPRVYELIEDAAGHELVVMDQRHSDAGPHVWEGKPYRSVAKTGYPCVTPFIVISKNLREHGFFSPKIKHQDVNNNFLILEHLGYGSLRNAQRQPIDDRYIKASELLAQIHKAGIKRDLNHENLFWQLPLFDRDALMIEASLMLDWYVPYKLNRPATKAERSLFINEWDALFGTLETSNYGIVLRDYHSPNLIWRDDTIGILDFQDAVWGPNAYDLASLAQDARVTIAPNTQERIIKAYMNERSVKNISQFQHEYLIMSLQRNTKILGIFIRLNQRDNKPDYMHHLSRIETYVSETLARLTPSKLHDFYAQLGLQ
jgi:N-acetylmuramate 1-kinase